MYRSILCVTYFCRNHFLIIVFYARCSLLCCTHDNALCDQNMQLDSRNDTFTIHCNLIIKRATIKHYLYYNKRFLFAPIYNLPQGTCEDFTGYHADYKF